MTYYSGSNGFLEFAGQRIGRVANWSITATTDLKDDSRVGDCEKSYKPGATTYSGNAAIWYYSDTPEPLLSVLFKTGEVNPSPAQFKLGWGGSGFAEKKLVFDAYITDAALSCQVGEVMQAQISFTVDGQLEEVQL